MADTPKYRSYSRLERFLQNFYSLIQTSRIHQDNHKLVIKGVENFSKAIAACLAGDDLTVKIQNDRVVIDDEMMPYNRITKILIDNMVRYFESRGLEGLRFFSPVKQASIKNILSFIHLLDGTEQQAGTQDWLSQGLAARNISWIAVIRKPKKQVPDEKEEFQRIDKAARRERARKDYSYILASFKEVAQKVTGKGRVGIRKTVRVVQDMVKNIMEKMALFYMR